METIHGEENINVIIIINIERVNIASLKQEQDAIKKEHSENYRNL